MVFITSKNHYHGGRHNNELNDLSAFDHTNF